MDESILCIECGEILSGDAKFCSRCGGKQPEKEIPAAEEKTKLKCASCDADLENSWFLCPYCGEKVEKDAVSKFVIPDSLEHSIKSASAAISQDGKYLAIKSEKINIVDVNTEELIKTIDIPYFVNRGIINCANINNLFISAISASNYYLKIELSYYTAYSTGPGSYYYIMLGKKAPISFKTNLHSIIYVNLQKKEMPETDRSFSWKGRTYDVLVSNPDGHCLAGLYDEEVVLFDTSSEGKYPVFCEDKSKAVISGVRRGFVIKDQNNINNDDLLKFGKNYEISKNDDLYACFSVYPELIAAGYKNGNIHIINSETGELLSKLKEGNEGIKWVSYSSDGKRLISFNGEKVNFWVKK